ncbi:MAG: ATPase [Clostridiales bacterium]|nr:ATPase [Clostridiales bacterium]
MNIYELIDLLEDELENSPNIPLTNKKRVDLEQIYGILDEMREEVPEEVRKAELVLREKQFILDDAKVQAEATIREAERRAQQMVEENEITQMAQRHAEEIIAAAQRNSKEIRVSARAYADDVLGDLESYVKEYHDLIRKNRDSLNVKARDNNAAPQREQADEREERAQSDNRGRGRKRG